MSLKDKVTQVLSEAYPGEGKNRQDITPQGSSKIPKVEVLNNGSDAEGDEKPAKKLAPKVGTFQAKPDAQGSSKRVSPEEIGSEDAGKEAEEKQGKAPGLEGEGAGPARNVKTVADALAAINGDSKKGSNRGTGEKAEHVGSPHFSEETEQKERKAALKLEVKNLFNSEKDLSEEFKEKATAIFEALVEARVAEEVEIVENRLADEAAQIVNEQRDELVNALDEILSDVAEQWLEENAVEVVDQFRLESAEAFAEGLKNLFTEHYIEIPEERVDAVEALTTRIDELEEELQETNELGIQVTEELLTLKKALVISEVTEDLADTESEKFASLVENVSYEDDDSYKGKLAVIKNQYFPKKDANGNVIESVVDKEDGSHQITEETQQKTSMDAVLKHLRKGTSTN